VAAEIADHVAAHALRLRRLGIDTYQELVIYMRSDCHACRAEGFEARSRVKVSLGGRQIVATLNTVLGNLLESDEASLSEAAWNALGAQPGDLVRIGHADPLHSESRLRAKVYGERLSWGDLRGIIDDVAAGAYSDLQLAAFATACAGERLDAEETTWLTRAMADAGERLAWDYPVVADKHCVGGLPGNRTTPIVVAIVAACGLPIPKTSSRAITSPAGTADAMEVLAPVDLDLRAMRRVVEREGGCVVWGGAARLSPADDILIRVEGPLDFDSSGLIVASVLSKKAAAGSTHVVLDMPVGPSAKVRGDAAADALQRRFEATAAALGLRLLVVRTDGSQPVGRGMGPALEARDVLAVLEGRAHGLADLQSRAIALAGALLELGGKAPAGQGAALAATALADGRAWAKFQAIREAQGGMRSVPAAPYTHVVTAPVAGIVRGLDNRKLARTAKLAGAPRAKAAGLDLHVRLGDTVSQGQPLFTLHAEAPGELRYALDYFESQARIIEISAGP
jgi:thymidine phosphorylase